MVRKANNLKESPYVIMFYFPLFTVPLSLVLMGNSWVDPTTEIWIYLFLVGLTSQLGQMFSLSAIDCFQQAEHRLQAMFKFHSLS